MIDPDMGKEVEVRRNAYRRNDPRYQAPGYRPGMRAAATDAARRIIQLGEAGADAYIVADAFLRELGLNP
jgi:hypothetical protein